MVKFRVASKNDMMPYLETVTQQNGTTNVFKKDEFLYIQNKVLYV